MSAFRFRASTCTRRAAVALCLLVAGMGMAQAVVNPLAFDRIDLADGLSQSTVLDIHQDQFGFIWLATENGLNRYDGRTIKTYYRAPGVPEGLRSDYIWAIEEDSNGDLWLGTDDAGLLHWDRETDQFSVVPLRGLNGKLLTDARISDLLVTADDEIWIGTRTAGVIVVDASGKVAGQYLHDHPPPLGERRRRVSSLLYARDRAIWVGTEQGAHRISPERDEITSFVQSSDHEHDAAPADNNISSLMEDHDGRIWIATYESGVSQFDPSSGQFIHLTSSNDSAPRLADNRVRTMLHDTANRIWIGTDAGITLIKPDGSSQTVTHEPANSFSLPNDLIMSLTEDNAGLIWVGTRGGGAAAWNPRSLSMGPRTPEELSGVHVNSFLDWGDGNVWIGTIGAGLMELAADGTLTPALPSAQAEQLQGSVMSLLRDQAGTIWIGTLSAGLFRFDPTSETLTALPIAAKRQGNDPWQRDAIGAPGIMSLAEGPDGTLWVGTFNGGVARVDTRSLAIDRLGFEGELTGIEGVRATALAVARGSELWIGTEANGLIAVDLTTGKVDRYRAGGDDTQDLPSDSIYSLHATDSGDLWIGTAARGLARLARTSIDNARPVFEVTTTADGLSSNVIFGIEPNGQGDLWLSSNNGLMRYSPTSGEVRAFHPGHGAFSDEFNFGAHYRAPDGMLYFGGPGGFNRIDTNALQVNRQPPKVLLTDILLFGEVLSTSRPPYLTDSLEFSHDQNVLSFEFAAMDFTAPERNLYSVKLQGFDREWSPPSTRNRATYTNLDPGEYTLLIRASNSEGVWAPTPLKLLVRIQRPPWSTWWAWLGYAVLLSAGLWLFLRLRFKAQERDARLNQLAYYDRITGLPNRDLFEQRGKEALRRIDGTTEQLVVLCIRFSIPKRLSQTLPRTLSNDMWSRLAAQLVITLHGNNHDVGSLDVARLDTDQFLVFMRTGPHQPDIAALGERLQSGWSDGLVVGEHRVSVAASIGVARAPEHATDIATLVHYAATASTARAMPQPGQIVIYDDEMTSKVQARLLLETRLRAALAQDELEIYFQPKFTPDRRIIGAEALLRWDTGDLGWIPPATFVALAEESDLIAELDTWVIHNICEILSNWTSEALTSLRIAINMSAANLNHSRIVRELIETYRNAGLSPERLEVELTESALLSDVAQTRRALHELKQAGFSIALDDFGTGYSSLTHLKSFAIDTVKIDREFVQGVDQSGQEHSICNAIIALAKSLGLTTVAEGVETEGQFETLVALGCDDIQGYLLARPMPAEQFRQLVESSYRRTTGD